MSSSASLLSGTTLASTSTSTTTSTTFTYPPHYSFPPFYTLQPNPLTRSSQLTSWSALIQAYCRHHKLFQLSPSELAASSSPLFHNSTINRRLSLQDIRIVFEYMTTPEGGRRAEWVDAKSKSSGRVWIWWRTPEEWADVVHAWVEGTGQKGSVLTVYELSQGDGVKGSELYELDQEVVGKALSVLVKRGKAQVFGEGEGKGVKFF